MNHEISFVIWMPLQGVGAAILHLAVWWARMNAAI